MAIPVTGLKSGAIFEENGEPFQVLKYAHTKVGRGLANIRVKVKNLKSGAIIEKTFNSGMKVEEAQITRKKVQFLYATPSLATFLDPQSYEQIEISSEKLREALRFIKEGETVPLIFFEEEVLDLALPPHVELEVTYAEKGFRGNSASSVLKPVKVETGIEVQVPLFIKTGDIIKVDTRTGEYVERVK